MSPSRRHAVIAAGVFAFAMHQCSQAHSYRDTYVPVALGIGALVYGLVRLLSSETGRDYLEKNFVVRVHREEPKEAPVARAGLDRCERAAINSAGEALRHMAFHSKPYRQCSYCKKRCARRPIEISTVHVTIYRPVPQGAKDLRIKDAQGWQAGWSLKASKCSCGNSLPSLSQSAARYLSN